MYEPIDAPKDFICRASRKAAKVAIIMYELNGVPIEKALSYIALSRFGIMLRREETKAWFSPDYWAYVDVAEELGWERMPPRWQYDFSEIEAIAKKAEIKLFHQKPICN